MKVLIRFPGVRDYPCGYRACTADILRRPQKECDPGLVRENRSACMFELLVKLKGLGARATEVPLVLRHNLKQGASKMRFPHRAALLGRALEGVRLTARRRTRTPGDCP
jgi:dolichol-phosphate mannosyltransferase